VPCRPTLSLSTFRLSDLRPSGFSTHTVCLTWETPGFLTLTHWDWGTAQATIRVPVSVSGGDQPPVISFGPRYLAEALVIGPVLRLIDGMSPGVTTGPSGSYCVIMPCRLTEVVEEKAEKNNSQTATPVPAMAA